MKSEETMYQANNAVEGTQVYNESTKSENQVKETATNTKGGSWKQVVIGGVSGVLLGSASSFFMSSASAVDDPDAPGNDGHNETNNDAQGGTPISADTTATVDGLSVATVSDDMSFGEAFAAAREQVGAGGVFEWHGGIYGTYYADEWNAMTPEEQAEFGNRVNYGAGTSSTADVTPETSTHDATEPEVVEAVSEEPVPQQDVEVQILGVENVPLGDGSSVTMGYAEANGLDVVVVDVDQDGMFDQMYVDVNGDGEVSDNEFTGIQGEGLSVADWAQQSEAQPDPNDVYLADNQMPDYINDADMGDFVS